MFLGFGVVVWRSGFRAGGLELGVCYSGPGDLSL